MTDENTIVTGTVSEITTATIAQLSAMGLIDIKKKKRMRRNWESALAYEYVEKFYGDYPHWFRVAIGPMPEGRNDPMYSMIRRWADVVVRMPDHMLIIELKMYAKPDVVGQINNYERLLPQTPMFRKWQEMPVKKKVVAALMDDDTKAYIESNNIETEVYRPKMFEEWYKEKILREKAE